MVMPARLGMVFLKTSAGEATVRVHSMHRGNFDQPFFFPRLAAVMQRVLQHHAQYRASIQHTTAIRYGIAVVALFAATALHSALQPYMGIGFPLPIFLLAILITGWYGGLGPGILATVVGGLLGTHLFVQPLTQQPLPSLIQLHLVFFVGEGVLLSIINEALFSAHQVIANTFESVTDGFVSLDTKWRFTYINKEAEKFIGRPAALLLGKQIFEELPELTEIFFRQSSPTTTRPTKPTTFETFYAARHTWLEVHLYPSPIGVSIYFKNVTARIVAEQESQRNFHLFNAVIESTYDAVSVKDQSGSYLFVNQAGARLLGLPVEKIIGKYDREILPPQVSEHIIANDARVLTTGTNITREEKIKTIDGEKTYVVTKAPLRDYSGQTAGIITLCHNITELKTKEEHKDEFISMASHELKTPLTSLNMFLDVAIMRLSQSPTASVLEYLQKMKTQVSKLTKIINELLDVSRMQAGKLEFTFEPFDLTQLVHDTVESLQDTVAAHRLRVTGTLPRLVIGDHDRIEQVLINLINNAVKYSPEANHVDILLTSDDQVARVSIQDFGIGIAPEFHDKIFQRFYQVAEQFPSTYPGLGMGLYISSEIVKRHGGRIWVSSHPGAGSTFTFSVPLA